MTEPTPPPEWAIERAQKALGFETPNDELAPWLASKLRELREDVAAALVAVRREAIEECARVADDGAAIFEGADINYVPASVCAADLAKDIAEGIRTLVDRQGADISDDMANMARTILAVGSGASAPRPEISDAKREEILALECRAFLENSAQLEIERLTAVNAALVETIRLAIIELSGIEKVSATGASVARMLREAVEKT